MSAAGVDEREPEEETRGPAEIFRVFLRLGCTSFGGPVAHLGYFQREFVERRRWLTAEAYAELIAIAQSLPGPASSQVGFAVGLSRAGLPGGLAAWMGFTSPSAALMLAFAFGHELFRGRTGAALLHGLQLVAVAVVAQAVLAMQRRLAPDAVRLGLAAAAAVVVLFVPVFYGTLGAMALGVVSGLVLWRKGEPVEMHAVKIRVSRRAGVAAGLLFAGLLTLCVVLRNGPFSGRTLFANLFVAGALVFGGGHVVLPILDGLVVAEGWISRKLFLAGYGAAQALPGPLFSFGAFVGAAARPNPHPLLFGLVGLIAIFFPGLLLMTAVVPFWQRLREMQIVQAALRGVNACVVGILAAALYRPVATGAVHSWMDGMIVLAAFVLLTLWRIAPWVIVLAVCSVCVLWGGLRP
jgi:chromate transporter